MEEGKRKYRINKRNLFHFIFFLIFICVCIYLVRYFLKGDNSKVLDDIQIDKIQITEEKTERMLQLEKLQVENSDIMGWIEIEGTKISYPVLQATDNDYYLTHNYKKEKASGGALFLDKDFDLEKPSTNYLIYGHRMENGTMFEDLMKYSDETFYKEHPNIRFTTNKEDIEYEIIAVFYSRVYYKSEKNVFRYYYFINAENEQEFNNYIENTINESIYDTDKTAEYGDQLLTLSTCEYSQEDGRFAVVARRTK